MNTTQQREADLARAHAPSPTELEAARLDRQRLAHAYKYDRSGRHTPERVGDRAMGAIIGLAVGEAVGISMEGRPRDSRPPRVDMEGGGVFGLERGQWAGDTAMALALLQSLEFRGRFDPTDFMDRLVEWTTEGAYACTGRCVGLEKVTADALDRYRRLGKPLAGDEDPDCLDSGSLVRVAPVAVRYWADRHRMREVAAWQSETTHANLYAMEACVAFADLLADAISGLTRDDLFRKRAITGASSIESIATGSWRRLQREDVRSTNNVLNLIDASLWCVHVSDSFAEAVLLATNLGRDAGTVAALTGQLAGALYGASSIPGDWTDDLAWYYQILAWAEPLVKAGMGT